MSQRQVGNAVSRRLLAGQFADGDTVLVDHGDGGDAFTKPGPAEQAA